MRKSSYLAVAASGVAALLAASPAQAVNVTLSGNVLSQCVLSLSTAGTLAPSIDGKRLSSSEAGGLAATLTVLGTGATPTLTFGAPTLSAPGGSTGGTTEIAYSSLSGANQNYTSSQTVATSALIDTFSINARVSKDTGFAAGTHTVTTVVTCAQP